MKLFAWPVALVLLALAVVRGRGARFAARRARAAGALPGTGVPGRPGAAVENVLRFPLGRGLVAQPGGEPVPGSPDRGRACPAAG